VAEPVRCFLLEPTHMAMVTLRRYRSSNDGGAECPGPMSYHDATSGIIAIVDATFARHVWDAAAGTWQELDQVTGSVPDFTRDDSWVHITRSQHDEIPHEDPRWPTSCAGCGYEFAVEDPWQGNYDLMYRRNDITPDMQHPDLMTLRQAPPGAMWWAWWIGKSWRPQVGGHPVVVRLPNGTDWMPDNQASNCGKRKDGGDGTDPDYRNHHCWILHGTPPDLTADQNGVTCTAGAGSILSGQGASQWHGFLRNGYLTN